jgi:hypothetical protein
VRATTEFGCQVVLLQERTHVEPEAVLLCERSDGDGLRARLGEEEECVSVVRGALLWVGRDIGGMYSLGRDRDACGVQGEGNVGPRNGRVQISPRRT